MPEIRTYPEMNEQIVRLLRFANTGPSLYAAQYVEELQAEVERLRAEIETMRKKAEWYDLMHRPMQPWELELEALYREDNA